MPPEPDSGDALSSLEECWVTHLSDCPVADEHHGGSTQAEMRFSGSKGLNEHSEMHCKE